MQFDLTEDQALIAESARDWLAGHYGFRAREAGVHRDGGAATAWSAWAELGWLALPLPAAHGGIDGGPMEAGVLTQALGRHLAVEPYVSCVLQAARLLSLLGSAAQQDRWLPALAAGRSRLAFAHWEHGMKLPWDAPRCTLLRQGAHGPWLLSGAKAAVEGAAGAAGWLVSAQEPGTGVVRIAIVEAGSAGVHIDAHDGTDGTRSAELRFDTVRLHAQAVLGAADADHAVALRRVLAEGVVARCWQATGAIQAALEQTAQYLKERRQFGKALAEFQVLQHRLAEMLVQCTEAQAACELAAMRLSAQAGDPAQVAASVRSKVARAARDVAEQSVQLHGAMGVCEELPIASVYRFMLAFDARDGDAEAHEAWLGGQQLDGGSYAHSATLGVAA